MGVLVAEPLPLAPTSAASDSLVISVPDSLYGAPPAESLPSYQEENVPPESLYGAPAESLPSYEEQPAAAPQMVMDASFNFAVDEDEHQFKEEADRRGANRVLQLHGSRWDTGEGEIHCGTRRLCHP